MILYTKLPTHSHWIMYMTGIANVVWVIILMYRYAGWPTM